MSTDPITIWIQQLAREGGSQAAERLWETYYSRLVELARRKIGPGKRRVTDEEDVVLSAFDSSAFDTSVRTVRTWASPERNRWAA